MQENTALHFAADHGHAEVVKLLLTEGADVNAKNKLVTPAFLSDCEHGITGQ